MITDQGVALAVHLKGSSLLKVGQDGQTAEVAVSGAVVS